MMANAVLSLIALGLLVVLFYGPWQSFCTDVARQFLFERRDKIFEIARRGDLEFSSREYREIRSRIEDAIRFAHELTLSRLLYLGVYKSGLYWRSKSSTGSELRAAVENVKIESTRLELKKIIDEVEAIMIAEIICKSAICWVLIVFLIVALIAFIIFHKVREWVKRGARLLGERAQIAAECSN